MHFHSSSLMSQIEVLGGHDTRNKEGRDGVTLGIVAEKSGNQLRTYAMTQLVQ